MVSTCCSDTAAVGSSRQPSRQRLPLRPRSSRNIAALDWTRRLCRRPRNSTERASARSADTSTRGSGVDNVANVPRDPGGEAASSQGAAKEARVLSLVPGPGSAGQFASPFQARADLSIVIKYFPVATHRSRHRVMLPLKGSSARRGPRGQKFWST